VTAAIVTEEVRSDTELSDQFAMTPPYFHDGSVPALPGAVRVMAQVQLGGPLTDPEVADIIAFLESLTGPLPPDFATAPVLPAGGLPASTAGR